MDKDWKPKTGKTYARVGLRAIISNKNGEVLLLKRTDHGSWAGLWDFPGGSLEYGEDPLEGIRREVSEETGFTVDDLKLFGVESYIKDDADFVVIVSYTGHADNESPVLSAHEHNDYRWFSPAQAVAEEDLPEIHKKFIRSRDFVL